MEEVQSPTVTTKNYLYLTGFYGVEHDIVPFRWLSENAEIVILDKQIKSVVIDFITNPFVPVVLTVEVNDEFSVFPLATVSERKVLEINLSNVKTDKISLKATYFIPSILMSNSNDGRKLSLKVIGFHLKFASGEIKFVSVKDTKMKDEIFSTFFDEISIFDQTKYPTKIADLRYTNTLFRFNSCIFENGEKPYLFARESELLDGRKKFNNTLRLFSLDDGYNVIKQEPLNIIDEVSNEQYEDPRVLNYNNHHYVSCANYSRDKVVFIHQKILIFDQKFNHVGNIHPSYDGNGASIKENTNHQKNWTWFIYNGKLHCVYRMNPHTVVEFDWKGMPVTEYKTHKDLGLLWKYGECRMGSNPILHDGQYHNFFHSSVPWKGPKRRYVMGYYTFEAHPPFRITNISAEPILYGNEKDNRTLPISPLVIFPCGAIYKNDRFVVSFGLNDEQTGIIEL